MRHSPLLHALYMVACCLWMSPYATAQANDTLRFTLHYPEGKVISSDPVEDELDSLLGLAGFHDPDYETYIHKVIIFGHTDSKGSHKSNQQLSADRASYIYSYLLNVNYFKGSPKTIVSGMGEDEPVADNHSEQGRAANRRVEVFIVYSRQKISKLPEIKPWGDTTIQLGDGNMLRLNLQDYHRIKTCLVYTRKTSLPDVFTELERVSRSGSYSNFYIFGKISVQWCADQCLGSMATLSVAVPDSMAKKYLAELRQYVRYYPAGQGRSIKLVKHSDRKWYVDITSLCRLEWIGCGGCGHGGGGSGRKRMKIVARGGYRLLYASPYGGGGYMCFGGDGSPRRKFKFKKMSCPGSLPAISVVAIKKGHSDTLYFASGTEETIDFRRRCFNCVDNQVVIGKVLGIEIHKRLLRRKYIIREKNYTQKEGGHKPRAAK